MSSEIRDIGLAESGEQKIEWVKRNCDLLRMLEEEFSRTKPFTGKKITLSVHLEAKTAYLCKVLAAGGAEMYVTGSNPLSTQDDVAAALVKADYPTFDEDLFLAEVARYNELCKKGVDEDFYKDPTYLVEIEETGPYYAAVNTCTFMTIMGGLRTSADMEVCDEGDEPIPGLFAIGNTAGNFYGGVDYSMYMPGLSLGRAHTQGYVTGKYVASL